VLVGSLKQILTGFAVIFMVILITGFSNKGLAPSQIGFSPEAIGIYISRSPLMGS